jgi:hypothetical protein
MGNRKFRGIDDKPGWEYRELADIRRQLREMRSAKTGQAMEIGSGGITVRGGQISASYPEAYGGQTGVFFGPYVSSGSFAGDYQFYGLAVRSTTGDQVFRAIVDPADGSGAVYIGAPDWQGVGARPLLLGWLDSLFFSISSGDVSISAGASINGDDSISMSAADGIRFPSLATTAVGANAVVDATTGALARSTSSRRYKQDISSADLDAETLLRLVPRRFRTKAEVAEQGDGAPQRVGFIAEEAAEVAPEFVTSDEDGPEAFSYATYVTGLQAIVRHQAEQIADLTARLERLEQAGPNEKG